MLIKVISDPKHMRQLAMQSLGSSQSVGLVPTMGALHEGHLELVRKSVKENDCTVVSIFVNRLQFNNQEDLTNYPRTFDDDLELLSKAGVNYVFSPRDLDFYKSDPVVQIGFGKLESLLEGKFRPGHFKGVGIVVSKLFNVVSPDRAYFGLKDLQQYLLIKRMGEDLSFPVDIIGVDTVREESGLALSSRNLRLSTEGRKIASGIFQSLLLIKKELMAGSPVEAAKEKGRKMFAKHEGIEIEYLEVVDGNTLETVEKLDRTDELAICFAGYVEGVRLIDNLYLRLN